MDRQMDHAVYLKTFWLPGSFPFCDQRTATLSIFRVDFFSSKIVLKTWIKIKENNNATEANKQTLISQAFKNFIQVFRFSK